MKKLVFTLLVTISILPINAQKTDAIRIVQYFNDTIKVYEYDMQNNSRVIYATTDVSSIPVCTKDDYIFMYSPGLSLYNHTTDETIHINDDGIEYSVGGFFKNKTWVYYSRLINDSGDVDIIIYDYMKKVPVKKISGFMPRIAGTADCLFYATASVTREDSLTRYWRYINRYCPENDVIDVIDTIELSETGKYDISEIVPNSKSEYCYRVYDEHEYRYYTDSSGTEIAFYPGGFGHFIDGTSKEQYDLTFSADGKYAAFTERNWSELTSIVWIDLEKSKRYKLEYNGSFPYVQGNRVYFLSDPDIVATNDLTFRQVENYTIYYFDINKGELKTLDDFEGEAQILY